MYAGAICGCPQERFLAVPGSDLWLSPEAIFVCSREDLWLSLGVVCGCPRVIFDCSQARYVAIPGRDFWLSR